MLNLVIVLSVLCSSVAQIFLKKGMLSCECSFSNEPSNIIPLIKALAFNPFLIGGVALHILALITWLYVLKHVEVSYAYPFISMGFVVVLLLSYFVFNENINFFRILGVIFIMTGIIIVGRSAT